MHRIDTPTAQKDKFGAGKNGFTAGNPQTGTPATDLDNDYFDMLQEELAGVVEATGVNLDKSKHNQLLTSLKALLLSRAHPFADIKADGPAAIAEALSNLRLERFDQDTNETRIWSPDKKSYILVQNGVWGAYSTNSPAGTLPLGLGFGGTGAKDAEGARTSLGLGNSATRNVGTVSGTVAAGDDSRITGAMQKNQNGNDIPDKTAFRSSIGLGSAATRAVGNGANQIPDMSFFSAELAINGWAKLPNGLIIQQGTSTAATPSSPDVLVNFPIPFPTGVLHIGEHDSNGGLSMTLWQLNNITRTAFYAGALGGVTRGNTTIRALATSTSCNWFAIGY